LQLYNYSVLQAIYEYLYMQFHLTFFQEYPHQMHISDHVFAS